MKKVSEVLTINNKKIRNESIINIVTMCLVLLVLIGLSTNTPVNPEWLPRAIIYCYTGLVLFTVLFGSLAIFGFKHIEENIKSILDNLELEDVKAIVNEQQLKTPTLLNPTNIMGTAIIFLAAINGLLFLAVLEAVSLVLTDTLVTKMVRIQNKTKQYFKNKTSFS